MSNTIPSIKISIDGKEYSPGDCTWLMYAGCGCVCGLRSAGGHGGEKYILDADEAFYMMYDSKDAANRDKALGFKMRLEPRENAKKILEECTHTPRFGIPEVPTPEGYQWRESMRGRRKHLYLDPDHGDFRDKEPACGGRYPLFRPGSREFIECARCMKAAEGMLS